MSPPNTNLHRKLVQPIRRNLHGNYEHAETGLVVNVNNKAVYGKQNKDGTVSPLTEDDIKLCQLYKFNYML
jgi:hypothetical protein